MREAILTEINIVIPLLVGMIGLLFIVLIDPYIRRKKRRMIVGITILVISLILHEWVSSIVSMYRTMAFASTLCAIFAYSVRPVVIVMFCHIVDSMHKHVIES